MITTKFLPECTDGQCLSSSTQVRCSLFFDKAILLDIADDFTSTPSSNNNHDANSDTASFIVVAATKHMTTIYRASCG